MYHPPVKYRPDIDGLRALAVLPVVLCHAGVRGFAGGFVGVDIFFVISGYLISRIIMDEVESGTFTLGSFYERRIRRILPALLAMLAGSFAMAWLYFLPSEMEDFSKTALTALFSASNFYFNLHNNYFDTPSLLQPMLHTWSLAVEEQFYIIFPLLILALAKWMPGRRATMSVLLLMGIASLAASEYGARNGETWAFYLLPSRAWELLAGTLIASGILPEAKNKLFRQGLGIAGLAMILTAIFTYHEKMAFPGLAALLPVAGSCMIIHAGRHQTSLVGSLLSLRPVVFVGLISYSLYLWHWPLITFFRVSNFIGEDKIRFASQMNLVLASLIVAAISWKFIEQPFRTRKGYERFTRKRLFTLAGLATLAISLAFGVAWQNGGFERRFSPEMLKVAKYTPLVTKWAHSPCYLGGYSGKTQEKMLPCFERDPHKKQHIMLTGDSQAAHLFYALRETFPELDVSNASVVSCRPLILPSVKRNNCEWLVEKLYGEYLKASDKNQTFILSGGWGGGSADNRKWQIKTLGETIDRIKAQGAQVIILGQSPFFNVYFPRLLAFSERRPELLEEHLLRERVEETDAEISALAKSKGVKFISQYEILCPNKGPCKSKVEDDIPMYVDKGHYTDEGALWMARQFKERGLIP